MRLLSPGEEMNLPVVFYMYGCRWPMRNRLCVMTRLGVMFRSLVMRVPIAFTA